jgi:D-methionine transport system substrate-binding protein
MNSDRQSSGRGKAGAERKAKPLLRVSYLLVACTGVFAGGCRNHDAGLLRVGVTPGPAEEILRAVEPELAHQGLRLDIVTFSDYIQPNLALAGHDVDANLYQNVVFLNQYNRNHQTGFVSLAKVYLPLMAIYPGRIKTLAALNNGARIAVPNDPVNHDRALLLLERAGLVELTHAQFSSVVAISANPRQIKLVELDAAQLPRSLADVDAAVINANFALDAGLNPVSGSLLTESRDSPYANVLAVNAESQSDQRIHSLALALTSAEVRSFIESHYKGAIYPTR